MATLSIYDFLNYKDYLNRAFAISGTSRGLRARLAEALNCQSAFVSKVLNGDTHFSTEHAIQISEFLGHSPDEEHYFLLLVQLGKSGSRKLETYFSKQIESIRKERREVKKRLKSEESQPMTLEEKSIYYSSWIYGAIHVMVSIAGMDTKDAIARAFHLSPTEASRYLEFLVSTGILVEKSGRYKVGTRFLLLGQSSPTDIALLSKHHTNWRIRAIHSLDRNASDELHYSGQFSLSRKDIETVRELLLKSLEKVDAIIAPSAEEQAFCLGLDFFRI